MPDHVSLWGLLIPIRRAFRQYVNLRPVRLWPGIPSPLRDVTPADVDMVIVRENNEGEYSEIGGRLHQGTEDELAVQEAVFTRRGTDRVMQYACALAATRSGRICSATKSNGIIHTMPFWDERFAHVTAKHPQLESEQVLIDALAAMLVLDPGRFDVIVASNLFGDILSDLAAAVAGSIGIAPSGNLNPEREYPSMFEPVHGSAPDIAGQGIANPIGADLVRRSDARAPRGRGGGRGAARRDRADARGRRPAHARPRRPRDDRRRHDRVGLELRGIASPPDARNMLRARGGIVVVDSAWMTV